MREIAQLFGTLGGLSAATGSLNIVRSLNLLGGGSALFSFSGAFNSGLLGDARTLLGFLSAVNQLSTVSTALTDPNSSDFAMALHHQLSLIQREDGSEGDAQQERAAAAPTAAKKNAGPAKAKKQAAAKNSAKKSSKKSR